MSDNNYSQLVDIHVEPEDNEIILDDAGSIVSAGEDAQDYINEEDDEY